MRRLIVLLTLLTLTPALGQPARSVWNSSTGNLVVLTAEETAFETLAEISLSGPSGEQKIAQGSWGSKTTFSYSIEGIGFSGTLIDADQIQLKSRRGDVLYWTRVGSSGSTPVPASFSAERTLWRSTSGTELLVLSGLDGITLSRLTEQGLMAVPAAWESFPDLFRVEGDKRGEFLGKGRLLLGQQVFSQLAEGAVPLTKVEVQFEPPALLRLRVFPDYVFPDYDQ